MEKRAFTLAEVLITLTIIGVIAAITIPNLYSKYQKHTYVVGLKKAYSQLQNAVKMIPLTENCPAGDYDCAGVFDSNDIDGQSFGGSQLSKFLYLLSKNMKTEKLCLDYTQKGCEWVYTLNPTVYLGLRTMDGTLYKIRNTNLLGNSDSTIVVDINGNKGPDKFGRDKYIFTIPKETKNGINAGTIIPAGSKLHMTYTDNNVNNYWNKNKCNTETANKSMITQAYSCTGRVLEENAMNY